MVADHQGYKCLALRREYAIGNIILHVATLMSVLHDLAASDLHSYIISLNV